MKINLLSVRDLHGPNRKCVVRGGLSFDMEDKELVVLYAGEAGVHCSYCARFSHRSQLLRSIARLDLPRRGEIIFRGQDIATYRGEELDDLRRRIQFVFTDDNSLNPRMSIKDTLKEVLRWNPVMQENSNEFILNLLSRLGMQDDMLGILSGTYFPMDFDAVRRTKISMARSLIVSPDLLIVDVFPESWSETERMRVALAIRDMHREFEIGVVVMATTREEAQYFGGRMIERKELFVEPIV
ncbi:MAG: ATP-binding cassette domain-containing protein [Bacillota bacterium]|nr:ATP-binding cassette domain-containing protein [Bacillota bacterium]